MSASKRVAKLCKDKKGKAMTGHSLRACKAFFDMSVDGAQAFENSKKHELRGIKAKKNRATYAKKTLGINK